MPQTGTTIFTRPLEKLEKRKHTQSSSMVTATLKTYDNQDYLGLSRGLKPNGTKVTISPYTLCFQGLHHSLWLVQPTKPHDI